MRGLLKPYMISSPISCPNSDQSALVSLVHEEGANAWSRI
jgi:hypothetical protein